MEELLADFQRESDLMQRQSFQNKEIGHAITHT